MGATMTLSNDADLPEMRILFEELLPRLKSLALDGDVKMSQATFVNGPQDAANPVRTELRFHRI